MKTIIVATDFSPNANNALQYAGALAACTNAKIILFNAFQLPLHASNTLVSPAGVDEIMQSQQQELEKTALKISSTFGVEVEPYIENAFLTDALHALVPRVQADLVVLGMHENDWSDRLFGNTTIGVIRAATYPVLVVPDKAIFNGIDKIVYAFNNQCLSNENKLFLLRDLASTFNAEVEVLHVEERDTPAAGPVQRVPNMKVERALGSVAHFYKDVAEADVVEGIEKNLQDYSADLLAVVPHKPGLWKRMLNPSITRQLALQIPIPLLVLPNAI